MTPDDMIAVIQAHKDGKSLECRKHGESSWLDLTGLNPLFNFQGFDFRVKIEPPKPREWWINIYGNDMDNVAIHSSEESASRGRAGIDVEVVHVREVLPKEIL